MTEAKGAAPEAEMAEMDLADEQQILEELQGKVFEKDKFVYPIQGGFSLTYRGVKYACRAFAEKGEAIEVTGPADVKYDPENKEFLWAQVVCRRVKIDHKTGQRVVLDSAIGSKRKWVFEKLKSGEVRPDIFFFEKAVGQAQRNAMQALLPQDFILEFVQLILKGGKASRKPQEASAAPQGAPSPATTQAPPQGNGGAAPAPAEKKGGSELSTLRQQFWAVLKRATSVKDDDAARPKLKALTGQEKVSALAAELLKKLGGLLRKVAEGECAIVVDPAGVSTIVHSPTKEVRWPEGYKPPQPQPAQAAAEATASAPGAPPAGEKWMF